MAPPRRRSNNGLEQRSETTLSPAMQELVDGVPAPVADALVAQDWAAVRGALEPLIAGGEAGPAAWEALADACWWLGDLDVALDAYEMAHHEYLAAERPASAARCALLLGAHAGERGESARGSAWSARAERLLAELPERPEHGYERYFRAFAALGAGDHEEALAHASEMQAIGERHGDDSLLAIGVMAEGRTLIKRGAVADGIRLLDESMLMALSGRLHPLWTGGVYCHLMDACAELQDLARAGEWTDATARWCDTVAEAVVYRGICRVHRAQVMCRRGSWDEAQREAAQAAGVEGAHVGTAAEAHYELGELARLRGDGHAAEDSFRRAHALGRDPQPGLARLRAMQGHVAEATVALRTALAAGGSDPLRRVPLCAALVEVALAAGEVESARAACAELRSTADAFSSRGLTAHAEQCAGALLLATADGDPALGAALGHLRSAVGLWQELAAPYDVARCRELIAQAHQALGDEGSAELELQAAAAIFAELGAAADLERLSAPDGPGAQPGGLSDREVEVLREVAAGSTNRRVAEALYISEKTVARHLANIYTKLGVTSRSAATAYAVQHGLTRPARRPPAGERT